MRLLVSITISISILSLASPALAYIGPGLGAGTLAVIFGFIASIFLAIFALLWYPLKRLLTRIGVLGRKKKETASVEKDEI